MSTDETPPDEDDDHTESDSSTRREVRNRLEAEADRALDGFDESIVDLLAWILDTETKARIYVHLRQEPNSTSDEIADGTGLYPSTVREALAELHTEEKVTRQKRQNDGAGNNPYEYSAIAPSQLVSDIVGDVQNELNTVFNLDRYVGGTEETDSEPVTITVENTDDEQSEHVEISIDEETIDEFDLEEEQAETTEESASDDEQEPTDRE